MDKRTIKLTVCLGVIAAIGPMATDMYLPAMPAMASSLGAADGEIELSVVGFFAGLCIGQLLFGPISDKFGRKAATFIGLSLFAIASGGCLLSDTAHEMMAWRFMQGFGGSVGMVTAISSVRDLHTGAMAAKLMSLVVAILGIAPIVAPMIGGLIVQVGHWHLIFWFLGGFSLLAMLLVAWMMPETRSAEMRAESHPSQALRTYARLLVDRDFIPYASATALNQAGFFAYIASISYVMMQVHGMSPLRFSLLFGVNAVGMIFVAQFSGRLVRAMGLGRAARTVAVSRASLAVLLMLLHLLGLASFPVLCVMLFLYVACHGLVMSTFSVLALDRQQHNAGTAAALIGALGFAAGALSSSLVSAMVDGTAFPLLLIVAASSAGAALIALLFFDRTTGNAAGH